MSEMFHVPCLSSTGEVRRLIKAVGRGAKGSHGRRCMLRGALFVLEDDPSARFCYHSHACVEIRSEIRRPLKTRPPELQLPQQPMRLSSHLQKHLTEQMFLFLAKSGHRLSNWLAWDDSDRGCGCWWSCRVSMHGERGVDGVVEYNAFLKWSLEKTLHLKKV